MNNIVFYRERVLQINIGVLGSRRETCALVVRRDCGRIKNILEYYFGLKVLRNGCIQLKFAHSFY